MVFAAGDKGTIEFRLTIFALGKVDKLFPILFEVPKEPWLSFILLNNLVKYNKNIKIYKKMNTFLKPLR